MSINIRGWTLFPTPPDSSDGEDATERLREMLHEADDIHRDHFERRVEAAPATRVSESTAPVITATPTVPVVAVAPARSWPRTVAVSVVLLTVAGAGTMVTAIVNALINKSIKDKNGDA